MIGAIQILSKSKITCWMDGILVPHPRRDAWLSLIMGQQPTENNLDENDTEWVQRAYKLAKAAADLLTKEIAVKQDV
jgi:hypothetical protein